MIKNEIVPILLLDSCAHFPVFLARSFLKDIKNIKIGSFRENICIGKSGQHKFLSSYMVVRWKRNKILTLSSFADFECILKSEYKPTVYAPTLEKKRSIFFFKMFT